VKKQSERRGTQYGNKRGKSVRQRQRARQQDERIMSALEVARQHEAALDSRIATEHQRALELDRESYAQQSGLEKATLRAKEMAALRENIAKRNAWPLADARQLVRVGYSVAGTARRTGWPIEMLADVTPGQW
jgi:hypothetical protein